MTPRQMEIYMVIDEFWKKYGFGPSINDIMYMTGDKGRGNVARICKDLIKLGECRGRPNKARSIRPSYLRIRDVP